MLCLICLVAVYLLGWWVFADCCCLRMFDLIAEYCDLCLF